MPRASVGNGSASQGQLAEAGKKKPRATLASVTPNEGLEVKEPVRVPRESLALPRAA